MSRSTESFDPYALVTALERRRVVYVLIGGFARIIRGTEEVTDGVDIVPAVKPENLRRLDLALADLGANLGNGTPATLDSTVPTLLELRTGAGALKVIPEPTGTRGGYDDLRRAATREPIGRGLRPNVASIGDLARMLAARGRERDQLPLQQLRTLSELERTLGRSLDR
jgi:hypothetical protein